MNTFQYVLLALGGLIGLSAFWDQIKDKLSNVSTPKPEPPKDKDKHITPTDEGSLAEVIVCWEHLQIELKERGLNKAASELNKIFPLFIETVKDEEKLPPPSDS